MASTIILVPIQPGKVDAWKAFVAEAHGSRSAERDASRQRAGVTHEVLSLAQTPQGDFALIFREADDIERAHGAFLTSNDPYDAWFRDSVSDLYGTTADKFQSVASGTVQAEYRPSGS